MGLDRVPALTTPQEVAMRTPALTLALAVVCLACDGGIRAVTPEADRPELATLAGQNGLKVTATNNFYFEEQETFPLCDGTYATGSIMWHEVIIAMTNEDGSVRQLITYNMVRGGRATGPDGTEYVVQQVNGTDRMFRDGGVEHRRSTVRIMVLSRGTGQNLFYSLDQVDGTLTVDCRPAGSAG